MSGQALWAKGQSACLIHTLDFLDVSSAVSALRACAVSFSTLRPGCLASTYGSLQLAENIGVAGFELLRQHCDEWLQCFQAVQRNPMYTFHLHYGCGLFWLGSSKLHTEALRLTGSLCGWRPGLPRPSRAGNKRKGIKPLPHFMTSGVDIHLLPAAKDPAVNLEVTLDARVCPVQTGLSSDGFIDSGKHDLIVLQACEPGVVLKDCGLAAACDLPPPLFVWLLNAHFRIPSNGYAAIVYGCIEACSGDFLLVSAVFEEFGCIDYDPETKLQDVREEAYFECVTVRSQAWPIMATLLEQCFGGDVRQYPACCVKVLDQGRDEGDSVHTDQFYVTRRFQKALRQLAMKRLGLNGTEEELADQGVNICESQEGWTFCHEPMPHTNQGAYDHSMPGPLNRIQKAERHSARLFQEIVGKAAFQELCGRSKPSVETKIPAKARTKVETKSRLMKRPSSKGSVKAKVKLKPHGKAEANAKTKLTSKSSRTKPRAKAKTKVKVKPKPN